MNAIIVTIGDEILMGQILDTNSKFIATKLTDMGVEVTEMHSVADEKCAIENIVNHSMEFADIVILTGGLGPTSDDRTKQVLAETFGTELLYSEEAHAWLLEVLAAKGLNMNKLNETQAIQPKDCKLLKNEKGTACGMCFERNGKILFSLPGVPFEMVHLMEKRVMPILSQRYPNLKLAYKIFKVYGITESDLAIKLEPFELQIPKGIGLAYLPDPGIIKLRLTAHGNAVANLETEAERLETFLSGLKYQKGAEQSLSLELGDVLKKKGLTLATAESCTGGNIAHQITLVPGSSAYFKGSVVSYTNEVKNAVLGVSNEDLEKYGAVSEVVAKQMALGVQRALGSDYAVSTTGVAGPAGGTAENPVGTVWIAVATPQGVKAKRFNFSVTRERNIEKATSAALIMLQEAIA